MVMSNDRKHPQNMSDITNIQMQLDNIKVWILAEKTAIEQFTLKSSI